MNRICIVLDKNGELGEIVADEPLEVFIIAPYVPHDRVYLYQSVEFGPEKVRALIGGFSVGHMDDDTAPRLPPSKPTLSIVS